MILITYVLFYYSYNHLVFHTLFEIIFFHEFISFILNFSFVLDKYI